VIISKVLNTNINQVQRILIVSVD